MAIEIRKATRKDITGILEIVNHSIIHSTAIYDYDIRNIEQQEAWFLEKEILGQPVIVAEVAGQVAGFGTYGTFRVKLAYQYTVEHSVYVAEDYIGRGIGKLLLKQLIELAKLDGYHTMIGCIDADNGGSIAFHEKFGFKISGTLNEVGFKFGRWLDLVLMQLLLK